jgi:hypothetical protein
VTSYQDYYRTRLCQKYPLRFGLILIGRKRTIVCGRECTLKSRLAPLNNEPHPTANLYNSTATNLTNAKKPMCKQPAINYILIRFFWSAFTFTVFRPFREFLWPRDIWPHHFWYAHKSADSGTSGHLTPPSRGMGSWGMYVHGNAETRHTPKCSEETFRPMIKCSRSAFFWHATRFLLVVKYRRFRTAYRSQLQGSSNRSSLKIGPIGCPETSVINYQSTLRNIPEKWRPHLRRDRSLKSRKIIVQSNPVITTSVYSTPHL